MQKVDQEIRRILDQQYGLARKLIEDNRDKMEAMTKALLEWETLDADQLDDIMAGLPPRSPKPTQQSMRLESMSALRAFLRDIRSYRWLRHRQGLCRPSRPESHSDLLHRVFFSLQKILHGVAHERCQFHHRAR